MNKIKNAIEEFPPSSPAIVMATGIVSLAAHSMHYETISTTLFIVNVVFFLLVVGLMAARFILFYPGFTSDVKSHAKGAGFLTIVAAAGILGVQYITLKNNFGMATGLLYFAAVCWVLILYAFCFGVITKEDKPSIEDGLSGSWLLIVVSTQSLSILLSHLQAHLSLSPDTISFLSAALMFLGFTLYLILISGIVYRLFFKS